MKRAKNQKVSPGISRRPFITLSGCGLSAGLLVLTFPKYDLWPLAWVALVPFLLVLDVMKTNRAFRWGFVWGALFFFGTLNWFIHMSSTAGIPYPLAVLAVVLLVSYLSLYFGAFAAFYYRARHQSLAWQMAVLPSGWVALEFLRDRLFSGFGWASLGYSQYTNPAVIQIADLTGVFGVSFLVVMGNVLFKAAATALVKKERLGPLVRPAACFFALLLAVYGYGFFRMGPLPAGRGRLKVAVVQGNVEQVMKWTPDAWPEIMDRYLELTRYASDLGPDLIIWPETSFPGYIWDAPERYDKLKRFVAEQGVPLLLGAVVKEGEDYFNSAILLSENGEEAGRYDKMHLVPFGEYLPLRRQIPILADLVPIEDFTAGRTPTLFSSFRTQSGGQGPFAVSICFEDAVPRVMRRLVKAGARFLVNITNDAWFLDTKEPYFHLQGAVFRAVENRRSLVRAANTGISGFISPDGRVTGRVQDDRGDPTYIAGVAAAVVDLNDEMTLYTKFGDIFAYLCFGCLLLGARFFKDS